MMKKKEKVTLSQMRESLAKACQFHFELFREDEVIEAEVIK